MYERLLSTRNSNVARVSLERCPCLSRTCSCCELASCSAQFGAYEVRIFFAVFIFMQLSSGLTFGDNVTFPGTSCRDTAFSVVACCALLRTCSFLSHPSLWHGSGRRMCSLVHIEFCVKTLHLGTSSPLPRYCCCVDCLYPSTEYLCRINSGKKKL